MTENEYFAHNFGAMSVRERRHWRSITAMAAYPSAAHKARRAARMRFVRACKMVEGRDTVIAFLAACVVAMIVWVSLA